MKKTPAAPQIGIDEVKRIAQLARLVLSEDEARSMARDLASILGYVRKLEELDVAKVAATTHAVELPTKFRDDAVRAGLPLERAMGNAPERLGDGFGVPKIIE